MARRREHLYKDGAKGAEERKFEEEYGTEHGREVYGAVVGKVRREEVDARTRSPEEWIRPHRATSDRGRRFDVKGHYDHIAPHSRGHHGGPCDSYCRRGMRPHKHRRGRSGSTRRG